MSEEEYYAYLRSDTAICRLQEFEASANIIASIDTILSRRDQFEKCTNDPHPFVYSIRETLSNDRLIQVIEDLYSTLNIEYLYKGAFKYEGQIFVVSIEQDTISSFREMEKGVMVEIPFCDRIQHPKFRYVARVNEDEICIDCIKNEIITIK